MDSGLLFHFIQFTIRHSFLPKLLPSLISNFGTCFQACEFSVDASLCSCPESEIVLPGEDPRGPARTPSQSSIYRLGALTGGACEFS